MQYKLSDFSNIKFNGVALDKVIYNGTTVWEGTKGIPYSLPHIYMSYSGRSTSGGWDVWERIWTDYYDLPLMEGAKILDISISGSASYGYRNIFFQIYDKNTNQTILDDNVGFDYAYARQEFSGIFYYDISSLNLKNAKMRAGIYRWCGPDSNHVTINADFTFHK